MLEPLLRRHAHMVVGPGKDELVGLEVLVVHHLPGLGAPDPGVLGDLAPRRRQQAPNLRAHIVADPVHAERSMKTSERRPWDLSHRLGVRPIRSSLTRTAG